MDQLGLPIYDEPQIKAMADDLIGRDSHGVEGRMIVPGELWDDDKKSLKSLGEMLRVLLVKYPGNSGFLISAVQKIVEVGIWYDTTTEEYFWCQQQVFLLVQRVRAVQEITKKQVGNVVPFRAKKA